MRRINPDLIILQRGADGVEGADLPPAATDLILQVTAYRAAQEVRARIIPQSLVDFLD